MNYTTPAPEHAHKKIFRGIRLDPDLDQAIAILLERLKTERGHKESFSSFCRRAIRAGYNQAVDAYNQERAAHATHD